MATLPQGWEADYDGARWFYRYTATGVTQFRFPKDGDVRSSLLAPALDRIHV